MAVKTREEILAELKARVGEQTDDETIAFWKMLQTHFLT